MHVRHQSRAQRRAHTESPHAAATPMMARVPKRTARCPAVVEKAGAARWTLGASSLIVRASERRDLRRERPRAGCGAAGLDAHVWTLTPERARGGESLGCVVAQPITLTLTLAGWLGLQRRIVCWARMPSLRRAIPRDRTDYPPFEERLGRPCRGLSGLRRRSGDVAPRSCGVGLWL